MSNLVKAGENQVYLYNKGGASLDRQTARQQQADLAAQSAAYGERAGGYGDISSQEYGNKSALRDDLISKYRGLYSQAGSDGGGGIGAYVPTEVRYNEAMDAYRELARTGGWTPEDIASAQSLASASGEGLYEGLRREMTRASASAGAPVYGSTLARMGRESAQQANRSMMEANMGIQSDIRNRKETGMSGVATWDKDYMNQVAAENERKNAYNRAAASARGNASARRRAEQAGYLGDLTGLLKTYENMPYAGLAEDTYGSATKATGTIDPTMNRKVLMGG